MTALLWMILAWVAMIRISNILEKKQFNLTVNVYPQDDNGVQVGMLSHPSGNGFIVTCRGKFCGRDYVWVADPSEVSLAWDTIEDIDMVQVQHAMETFE